MANMKRMNKAALWVVAGLTFGTAIANNAFAGGKVVFTMSIDTVNRRAFANISDVRNSSNNVEFFNTQVSSSNNVVQAALQGKTAAGTQFSCTSLNANIIAATRSISGDSFVDVHWDANGNCTSVDVRQASSIAPKVL
jgi:hypothetical protein